MELRPGLGNITSEELGRAAFPEAAPLTQLVEDLHRMQQLTGSVLRIPANIKTRDVATLRRMVRLLDGEDVEYEGVLRFNLRAGSVADFLDRLTGEAGLARGGFIASSDIALQVGDLELAYGPAAIWAPHAKIRNLDALRNLAVTTGTSGEEPVVELEATDLPFTWVSRDRAEAHLASRDQVEQHSAPNRHRTELSTR